MASSFTACSPVIGLLSAAVFADKVAEAEAIPRIAFDTETLSENSDELIMTAEEIRAAELTADDYRGSFHYDKLTENEQAVYNALEYAMENGYTYVYVDDLLVSDADVLCRIAEYLSLDSPLLEQNLRCDYGTFTTYYEVDTGFIPATATLDGIYIYLENFKSEWWEKKQQALVKAQQIVDGLSAEQSDAEKAEELYGYVLDNVTYYMYDDRPEEETVQSYLYDGLINGRTQCDGTANMYSLLLNIAGIECFEKQFTPQEGDEEEIGHTWNMVKLGENWYNADATAGTDEPEENFLVDLELLFGFEDMLQAYTPDYAEIYPECPDSLVIGVDAHMSGIEPKEFAKAAKKAISQSSRKAALILVDSYDESKAEDAVQRTANSLRGTVMWYTLEAVGGRTAVIVIKQ